MSTCAWQAKKIAGLEEGAVHSFVHREKIYFTVLLRCSIKTDVKNFGQISNISSMGVYLGVLMYLSQMWNEGVLQTNPCGKPIGKFVCKMQGLTTSRIPFGYRKISVVQACGVIRRVDACVSWEAFWWRKSGLAGFVFKVRCNMLNYSDRQSAGWCGVLTSLLLALSPLGLQLQLHTVQESDLQWLQ